MNSNTINERKDMRPPSSQEQEINLLELVKKVWDSRKLILRMCGIGAIVGLVIGFSTPKEYTASTLIAPESRRAYPGKSALVNMEDDNLSSSITGEKDAIFPVLYPEIINSTPFLIRLFDIKVREQKDSVSIPLSQYLKERQKAPWWRIITSVPFKLTGWIVSLFKDESNEDSGQTGTKMGINPFRLNITVHRRNIPGMRMLTEG